MQGDVVRAAQWVGGALVLSSIILVIGVNLAVSRHSDSLGSSVVEAARQQQPPVVNVQPQQDGRSLRNGDTIIVKFDGKSALLVGGIPYQSSPPLKVEVQDKTKP